VVFSWEYGGVIGGFSAFLDIQTALVAEFYGVIHVIEETKR